MSKLHSYKLYRYTGPTFSIKDLTFSANCLLKVKEEYFCPITNLKWLVLEDKAVRIRMENLGHFVEVSKSKYKVYEIDNKKPT